MDPDDRLIGQTLSHYRIVARMGGGGMGVVYKAEDTRLRRPVALKFVSEELSRDPEALSRFTREAQTASALNHENICTVHDVGEQDGRSFIVMEYLEGMTLKDRLAAGAMSLNTVLDVGIQIANALDAAHTAGIIHRDIKPANVFIGPRDRVKVLDFGLAKMRATHQADVTTMAGTRLGAVMGTVAYMAPEQASGETVDHRADVWSFGVVLSEMATGTRPVPGVRLRVEETPELERIISKCLEPGRELRYQHVAELRTDLERLRSGPGATLAPPRRSKRALLAGTAAALAAVIAAGYWAFSRPGRPTLTETDTIVLSDFTNTTGDAVFDETLSLGLAVQLRQSPFLNLLPDQRIRRVMTMMGQPSNARLTPAVALEVCERSGSAAVVEGSIASLGSQYVLGLRATDCRSGEVLDTQQSQVPGKEDVLGALSAMAGAFRERAGESLATIRTHEKPLIEATTASIEALKAFSRARAPGGCAARVPLYERAVQLDPEFAVAHASLVTCYSTSGRRELAIQSATRAYELRHRTTDPERFQIEYSYDRDVTGDLEKAFQIATLWTQTYPRDTQGLGLRSGYSAHGTGRYEDVLQSAERALTIVPGGVFAHTNSVSANLFLDRFDAVARAIPRIVELLDPRGLAFGYYGALIEQDTGSIERLVARFKDSSDPELLRHAQSLVLARAGQLERARTLGREAIDATEALGRHETVAIYESAAAVWEAWSGNLSTARRRATTALSMMSGSDVSYAAGFALALAGDTTRSESLANDLERRFPRDTIVRFTYVPALRALAAVARHEPGRAIELLQANVPYERAVPPTAFNFFFGSLYPVYVRAQAYAANGQHKQAVAELQKILDHRGLMMGDPAGARALLEKARSLARAGDQMGARAVYEDFLSLWKDADQDVPVLAQAQAEYAKLK